jgi:hypothetical protein
MNAVVNFGPVSGFRTDDLFFTVTALIVPALWMIPGIMSLVTQGRHAIPMAGSIFTSSIVGILYGLSTSTSIAPLGVFGGLSSDQWFGFMVFCRELVITYVASLYVMDHKDAKIDKAQWILVFSPVIAVYQALILGNYGHGTLYRWSAIGSEIAYIAMITIIALLHNQSLREDKVTLKHPSPATIIAACVGLMMLYGALAIEALTPTTVFTSLYLSAWAVAVGALTFLVHTTLPALDPESRLKTLTGEAPTDPLIKPVPDFNKTGKEMPEGVRAGRRRAVL